MAAPLTGAVSTYSIFKVLLVIPLPLASGVLTRTTSWTDPEAPAASEPIVQVTTPAESEPPPVADTNVMFAGTASDRITPRAEERRVGEERRSRGTPSHYKKRSGASVAARGR